jgi:diguanylate cyclase (GGDEF)-like protein
LPSKKPSASAHAERKTKDASTPKANPGADVRQGLLSLYHATAELQFSKPLPALLKSLLRGLKSGTGISKAAILIKDEASFSLIGSASIGLTEEKISKTSVLLTIEEESDLLRFSHTTHTLTEATPAPERLLDLFEKEFDLKDAELLALEIRDNLVGVLVFEKPTATLLREILVIFSRQAALTIENAKLFTKVEEMALRDTLTGLYNRRYFNQILDYELNRAKRYHQPLSLIFLDLDHFKEINDQFGHSVGDQFLKQIAQKLSGLFRTTDLVARYAGDEFIAILPATAADGAMILARRLQETLGNYQIMVRGKTLKVSVSVGVDTYEGTDGIGGVTFIDRADKAMYEAKAGGRNCVRSFQQIAQPLVG